MVIPPSGEPSLRLDLTPLARRKRWSERRGGRTPTGLFTRIAQRLLAMAVCIWHNWATGADDKRSLTAYYY
jgi:hypothetical protein